MEPLLTILIILFAIMLVFIIASLPLYFAIKFLGGKTTLFKAVIVNLFAGFLILLIHIYFKTYGSIIAFLSLVLVYRESFRLKWWKAFFVWLVELFFVFLLALIAFLIVGLILGTYEFSIFLPEFRS
ncbi:hypothetical protein HYU50_05760 [Candidatus Woesearchaeota archaeon]|nr:hypothetical protein [Candidatus Woesearchaeota archaeon]